MEASLPGGVARVFTRTLGCGATDATCDGMDDDCSGEADEDYVSAVSTCGSGVCVSTGMTACVAGHVTDSCVVEARPFVVDSTCDGIDDDCSGEADEEGACTMDAGVADAGEMPTEGSGSCACAVRESGRVPTIG